MSASSSTPEQSRSDLRDLELLRPAEVAVLFQCSPKHIYTLIKRGELEAMRLIRELRISRVAVERYIARSTTRHTQEAIRRQRLKPMRGKTYWHPVDDDLVLTTATATGREHGPTGAATTP